MDSTNFFEYKYEVNRLFSLHLVTYQSAIVYLTERIKVSSTLRDGISKHLKCHNITDKEGAFEY